MYKPFLTILRLCAGDFPAKALNFITFVYLARILGVNHFGVLEFALSIFAYFLFLADAGLELWATREAARGHAVLQLAARVVPLRFLLALVSFCVLLIALPVLPDYPHLKTILLILGLTLFANALSLKWVFLGAEKMGRVGLGLVLTQFIFTLAVVGFVRDASAIFWIPVFRLLADLVAVVYFLRLFVANYGSFLWPVILSGASNTARSAFVLGGTQGLGLMGYNFDSIFLGLMAGPTAVGLYNAAYKPVTAALAAPITYYQGLFPTLARTFSTNKGEFRSAVCRSLQLTIVFALPFGILSTMFATEIIEVLFGVAYRGAVPALQVLAWSAVLVTVRGTFKHGLNAAGRADLDLRSAGASVALNVGLNLLLIPRYGILGAAVATVAADVLWLFAVAWYLNRHVVRVDLHSVLLRPLAAAGLMVGCVMFLQSSSWILRASVGALVYAGSLLLFNGARVPGLAAGWSADPGGK